MGDREEKRMRERVKKKKIKIDPHMRLSSCRFHAKIRQILSK